MTGLFKKVWAAAITLPIVVGAAGLAIGAGIGVTWSRSDVIPVVLVQPGIGGFVPTEGSSIGTNWPKSEVKAVLLVKPGIGGFEPREGSAIGNTWGKQEILPVMLVEPSAGGFAPLRDLTSGTESTGYPPSQIPTDDRAHGSPGTLPSIIETQIDGDFDGWEGETIVKLMDGHIWQQTEYYYEYHYAFMPKVVIFKTGNGYKMKVEGVRKPVGVKQLK